MKRTRIYIDGVEADVSPETVFALTFQFYSPLNPNIIRVSFSNELELPLTNTNKGIIGLGNSLKSTTNVHKTKLPCRVVQDGIETIPNGYIVIQQSNIGSNTVSCYVFSIDGDLYSTISDRDLNDLNYTDLNQGLEPDDVYGLKDEAEIAGGSGEVFIAVLNLGQNIFDNAGTPQFTDNYYIVTPPYTDNFIPILFGYKQILQRIISQAGFNYDFGELVGTYPNPKFSSLAVMQAGYKDQYKFQYSAKFRESVEFAALTDANESFVNIGAGATRVLQFLSTVKPCDFYEADPAGAARSRYVVSNSDTALGYFNGTFRFTGVINLSASTAEVAIYIGGVKQTGTALQALSVGDNKIDIYTKTDNTYLGFKNGDIIEVRVRQIGANPCTITYYIGCRFEFTCFGAGLQYVYLNQIMPTINQLDFYKDFLFRFGQIPRESNKTVYFKSLKDILADVTGMVNWTGKRYKSAGYFPQHLELAQRNYYQYDFLDETLSEKYGSGYFDLDDETLPAEAVYVSIWGSTLDETIQGINCASISTAQENLDAADFPRFFADMGNRLFLTRQKYTKEPNLWMDPALLVGPETDYTVACFTKLDTEEYERSLSYQKVLQEWYTSTGSMDTGFLQRLKNAKFVTYFYKLDTEDIANYNPHKMIFDSGDQFIFPTIKSFVPGKLTEVQMLKI